MSPDPSLLSVVDADDGGAGSGPDSDIPLLGGSVGFGSVVLSLSEGGGGQNDDDSHLQSVFMN